MVGVRRYVIAWAALLLLTGLTFGLSFVELGRWSLPAALTIALCKGSIVALLFMHLWEHGGANRIVFLTALVFLALLMTLVSADVATRFPWARPN